MHVLLTNVLIIMFSEAIEHKCKNKNSKTFKYCIKYLIYFTKGKTKRLTRLHYFQLEGDETTDMSVLQAQCTDKGQTK